MIYKIIVDLDLNFQTKCEGCKLLNIDVTTWGKTQAISYKCMAGFKLNRITFKRPKACINKEIKE